MDPRDELIQRLEGHLADATRRERQRNLTLVTLQFLAAFCASLALAFAAGWFASKAIANSAATVVQAEGMEE